jgi:hypothetical protein
MQFADIEYADYLGDLSQLDPEIQLFPDFAAMSFHQYTFLEPHTILELRLISNSRTMCSGNTCPAFMLFRIYMHHLSFSSRNRACRVSM